MQCSCPTACVTGGPAPGDSQNMSSIVQVYLSCSALVGARRREHMGSRTDILQAKKHCDLSFTRCTPFYIALYLIN